MGCLGFIRQKPWPDRPRQLPYLDPTVPPASLNLRLHSNMVLPPTLLLDYWWYQCRLQVVTHLSSFHLNWENGSILGERVIAFEDSVLADMRTLVSFIFNTQLAYSNMNWLSNSLLVDYSTVLVHCEHLKDLTYLRHLVSEIHCDSTWPTACSWRDCAVWLFWGGWLMFTS